MQNTVQNVKTRDFGARTATTLFNLKLKAKQPALQKIALAEARGADFIPYACHYDENTLLTKSGDLIQILIIGGLPFETSDPDFLNLQKNLRNTLFRSITKSRYAVYVHMVRRKQNVYPEGNFPEGFSKELNEAWKKKHSGLELYVNDFYT